MLIEHQADMNAEDRFKRTPLHRAAGEGNVEVCRLLVEHKANLHARDSVMKSVLMTMWSMVGM